MRACLPLACCLLLSLICGVDADASDAVTVYRCVDARGHVTLADAPCARGTTQQVRQMQRPTDGPAGTTPPPPKDPATGSGAPPPPQLAVMRPPEPMYECTTPDGERYTSETDDGNPRWVPLWTLGYRSGHGVGGRPSSGGSATRALNTYQDHRPLGGRVGAPSPRPTATTGSPHRPRPPERPHRPGYGDVGGAGTWVRDTCHALPQSEVCARLVDRRDQIRSRFFNAQEQERNLLRREERGINARLGADCGRDA